MFYSFFDYEFYEVSWFLLSWYFSLFNFRNLFIAVNILSMCSKRLFSCSHAKNTVNRYIFVHCINELVLALK